MQKTSKQARQRGEKCRGKVVRIKCSSMHTHTHSRPDGWESGCTKCVAKARGATRYGTGYRKTIVPSTFAERRATPSRSHASPGVELGALALGIMDAQVSIHDPPGAVLTKDSSGATGPQPRPGWAHCQTRPTHCMVVNAALSASSCRVQDTTRVPCHIVSIATSQRGSIVHAIRAAHSHVDALVAKRGCSSGYGDFSHAATPPAGDPSCRRHASRATDIMSLRLARASTSTCFSSQRRCHSAPEYRPSVWSRQSAYGVGARMRPDTPNRCLNSLSKSSAMVVVSSVEASPPSACNSGVSLSAGASRLRGAPGVPPCADERRTSAPPRARPQRFADLIDQRGVPSESVLVVPFQGVIRSSGLPFS